MSYNYVCLLIFSRMKFTGKIYLYFQISPITLTALYIVTVYFHITVSEPTQHDSVNQVRTFNTITTSCAP